jgi:class 3 adenylate cyclase
VSTTSGTVASAWAAYRAHDWVRAFEAFSAADAGQQLAPDELEALATAAGNAGRPGREWNRLIERAQAAFIAADDMRGAARTALELARNHVLLGENNVGVGWWMHAARFLEGLPECPEHGLWTWMEAYAQLEAGEFVTGGERAHEAVEIARRTGDRDVEALALASEGHAQIAQGDVAGGLALLGQASALAAGGSLQPSAGGEVLCSMIWACRNLGDWRRAAEWTDVSLRYCDEEAGYYYPGLCRVHRAEVERIRGDYERAEQDLAAACDQLLARHRDAAGWAYREMGEVRMRRGDFAGAMEAWRRAMELGVEPQPGLARLREAEGDAPAALRMLERALTDDRFKEVEARAFLFPVVASIAIAAGDLDRARAAVAEMEALGARVESTAHQGALHVARGELALAEGRLGDANALLRRAVQLWLEVDAPYESARARVVLARVYEAEGDLAAARLEREAALGVFVRLGAEYDARLLRAMVERPPERALRTFMFTDIVESTRLLDVLGDEAWSDLLGWHDRTLRACFDAHDGEEVKHEGDGFFVTFATPISAIDCAIAVQRSLATHRSEHGFAPRVRIGLHAAEATRHAGDYAGRGVHESARIAAAAGAGEIFVSETSLPSPEERSFAVIERRTLTLKGFTEPVDVVVVDWR